MLRRGKNGNGQKQRKRVLCILFVCFLAYSSRTTYPWYSICITQLNMQLYILHYPSEVVFAGHRPVAAGPVGCSPVGCILVDCNLADCILVDCILVDCSTQDAAVAGSTVAVVEVDIHGPEFHFDEQRKVGGWRDENTGSFHRRLRRSNH